MVIFIDQSRYWRGQHPGTQEWTWLLEVLFRRRPERRPASGLEVLLLSRALGCPEEPIERHRSGRGVRLVPMDPEGAKPYTPNMPD
jgi:hypothetical protein